MGMAASQARLLSITARLADNELRSQTINNAKMRLATQSSQASENYISALNQANYQFTNYDQTGGVVSQPLTYNALTAYSPYNTQYGLINSAGQILVSEREAEFYKNSGGNLDAFLKAHDLEYSTTYFENIGRIRNNGEYTGPKTVAASHPNYPEPFKEIKVEDLQKMFDQYNSLENSTEVEKFEKTYSAFNSETENLKKYGSAAMEKYLLHGADLSGIVLDGNHYKYTGTGGISDIQRLFENSNYYFNINSLYRNGFISEELKTEIIGKETGEEKGILHSVTVLTSGAYEVKEECSIAGPKVKIDDTTGLEVPGTSVYEIDGGEIIIEVNDVTHLVTRFDYSKLSNTDTEGTTFENTTPATNPLLNVKLETALNNFKYKLTDNESEAVSEYEYKASVSNEGEYTVKTITTITDSKAKEQYLNDMVDYIMNLILFGADYENFANFLVNTNPTTLKNQYGIDIKSTIDDGITMKQILDSYTAAKDEFLKNIFDDTQKDEHGHTSLDKVKEDLTKHNKIKIYDEEGRIIQEDGKDLEMEVNVYNLQDLDFLLQYISQRDDIAQSESFNTVIKEYIIDNIIDEYGTPKYAWIDTTDKDSNQGNADAKAQWYTNLFHRMQRGYKALENGLASSKEWIEYALENGTVYLEQVDQAFAWNALDFKTCSRITEETNDKAIAKAEAEYNRAMNDIKTKDNIYDLELKNIDTEHNALQTEYDVIKGVINKNIERNFKFNQSA